MLDKHLLIGTSLALALGSDGALAGASAGEMTQLKSSLAPLDAEKAGNAVGSIPTWTGGITRAPADHKPGQYHPSPFAADKSLSTTDKVNLEQYREHLAPGQLMLFKTYPDSFQMPVYPNYRFSSVPRQLYDNIFANATSAGLLDGGNGFADACGRMPFSIPKSGVETLWNRVACYHGTYVARRTPETAVQRNGSYSLVTSQQEALFKHYLKGSSSANLNNLVFYYLSSIKSPARLAGGAVLVYETLDQAKEPHQAWGYDADQRRVRHAPSLAYDTPTTAVGGPRTADDIDTFDGVPDRYDRKLLGKKEICTPCDNYKISNPEAEYEELLKSGYLDPQYIHRELHRVWIVEGALKPGVRYVYSKHILYLDEDSWSAVVVNQYDGRDELWRVSVAYLKNFYNPPYTWSALDMFHDLQACRYHVQNLDNKEPGTIDFTQAVPDSSYFKPSALCRRDTH